MLETGREKFLAYLTQQREAGIVSRTIQWTFKDAWDQAGRRVCVWCGKPLPAGKAKMRWCKGGRCAQEFLVFKGDMGLIRTKLRNREKERCEICQADLKALAVVLKYDLDALSGRTMSPANMLHIWGRWRGWFGLKAQAALDNEVAGFILQANKAPFIARVRNTLEGFSRRSLWQADHILAVECGGSGTDLSNFQLLCTACHLSKTNKAKAEKARQRALTQVKPSKEKRRTMPDLPS